MPSLFSPPTYALIKAASSSAAACPPAALRKAKAGTRRRAITCRPPGSPMMTRGVGGQLGRRLAAHPPPARAGDRHGMTPGPGGRPAAAARGAPPGTSQAATRPAAAVRAPRQAFSPRPAKVASYRSVGWFGCVIACMTDKRGEYVRSNGIYVQQWWDVSNFSVGACWCTTAASVCVPGPYRHRRQGAMRPRKRSLQVFTTREELQQRIAKCRLVGCRFMWSRSTVLLVESRERLYLVRWGTRTRRVAPNLIPPRIVRP